MQKSKRLRVSDRTLTLRALDIPSIHKFGIGFDSMFDELVRMSAQQSLNYPPYNIVKYGETFCIELAVAGFEEGEISIELEGNVLSISGLRNMVTMDMEYLHQGISNRDFHRKFTLAEGVELLGASQKNGILSITLQKLVPEEKKPKSIAINYSK